MANLLDPKDINEIKKQYAQWKSGTNPHYPSDQEWFAQAGASAHASKLSKLTEGEIREKIAKQLFSITCEEVYGQIPDDKAWERIKAGHWAWLEKADEIRSLLTPLLLKLKEENERLKGEITVMEAAINSGFGNVIDQAVQQERERIASVLVKWYKCPLSASKEDCKNKLTCNNCWEQALEQER